MSKFTLVGSFDDQEPLYVLAFASSLLQLQQVWKALYPQSTFFVLEGHCRAADGRTASDLAERVRLVCGHEPDKRSADPTLNAYLAWHAALDLAEPEQVG